MFALKLESSTLPPVEFCDQFELVHQPPHWVLSRQGHVEGTFQSPHLPDAWMAYLKAATAHDLDAACAALAALPEGLRRLSKRSDGTIRAKGGAVVGRSELAPVLVRLPYFLSSMVKNMEASERRRERDRRGAMR